MNHNIFKVAVLDNVFLYFHDLTLQLNKWYGKSIILKFFSKWKIFVLTEILCSLYFFVSNKSSILRFSYVLLWC